MIDHAVWELAPVVGTAEAWNCRARPYDPFGQLAFESILPITVESTNLDALTQLVVRTNWRLLTGAFQLDAETGELAFRTMLFLPTGVELSDPLCRGLVYSNVLTVDRCLTEFMKVAAGDNPLEAFERLEL